VVGPNGYTSPMASPTLAALESQLAALTPGEKAQVLAKLLPDVLHAWPGIEKTPNVSGGDACVVRTRIAVWMLDGYRRIGWSEAKILESYPTLRAADLVNAWAYADAHTAEIDAGIAEHEGA
jgi:uncharacterized protein (DUF433 family)